MEAHRRRRRCGDIGTELSGHVGKTDGIAIVQSRFGDRLSINLCPIGGVQVFKKKFALLFGNPRVRQRDGGVVDDDGIASHAPNRDVVILQNMRYGRQTRQMYCQGDHGEQQLATLTYQRLFRLQRLSGAPMSDFPRVLRLTRNFLGALVPFRG